MKTYEDFSQKRLTKNNNMIWCNDEVTLTPNDPNFLSLNQKLAGPPNPKTLIAPVVVPPPAALDFWRDNNLINHSHINRESQNDLYLSGYKVSNCCDRIDACMIPEETVENYKNFNRPSNISPSHISQPNGIYEGISDPLRPVRKPDNPKKSNPIISPIPFSNGQQLCDSNTGIIKEGFESYHKQEPTCRQYSYSGQPTLPKYKPIISPQPVTVMPFTKNILREDFTTKSVDILPNESGWVNTTCGYNPEQLYNANLPTNLRAGNCEKQEEMRQFNKNLFTQNIQPDIYTQNEIIEPINSNIGISFTQQFPPATCQQKDGKGLTYTEHDPRIFHPKSGHQELPSNVTEADVYDPRFYGYGTSYRAYNDDNTGQTRFYYDDVNSVRMPNYITRSNIDFANYADTYGPLQEGSKFGNKFNSNIRSLAQDTFLRSSLQQRTELQERLMRKRNNELWRVRKYPMRTFGSQMKRC